MGSSWSLGISDPVSEGRLLVGRGGIGEEDAIVGEEELAECTVVPGDQRDFRLFCSRPLEVEIKERCSRNTRARSSPA